MQRSPELCKEAQKQALRELFRRDLFVTATELCGYRDITWNTHGPMITALEAPTKRKLIVMPRGSFKSSVGTIAYSIWLLIRDPNVRILIDSEVYKNSKNFLREIKNIIKSEKFKQVFGDWEGAIWTEGEIVVSKRTKNLKEGSIVCGGVETVKVGAHFDVIIHDDMNSGNNSETVEMQEKVLRHYRMNFAILDPGGIMVVTGTRYCVLDIIGTVLLEIERDKLGTF